MVGETGPSRDGRSERGATTRRRIIDAATHLFTSEGYERTSIEQVLRASGISRGALYHHFDQKDQLFRAVLEAVEEGVAARLRAAASAAANPLDALRLGCAAWLALATDPTVRQIVLIDAPAVVGWEGWRSIDERYALGLLRSALERIAAAGRLDPAVVEIDAHVLLAALTELAMFVARAPAAAAATSTATIAIEQLLSRFAGVEPNAPW